MRVWYIRTGNLAWNTQKHHKENTEWIDWTEFCNRYEIIDHWRPFIQISLFSNKSNLYQNYNVKTYLYMYRLQINLGLSHELQVSRSKWRPWFIWSIDILTNKYTGLFHFTFNERKENRIENKLYVSCMC